MKTETTRAAFERFIAVRNGGDTEALMALMADDVRGVWPEGAPLSGYEGSRELAEMMTKGTNLDAIGLDKASFAAKRRRLLVDGNTVVVEAEISAATTIGTSYENVYITIYEFDDDGLLVEMSVNTDTLTSARHLPWAFAEKIADLAKAAADHVD